MKNHSIYLGRIKCSELEKENFEDILKDIQNAKSVLTFYESAHGQTKCLFTDLSENEFWMMIDAVHNNVQVFDFLKLLILTIEENRIDYKKGYETAKKVIEYLRIRNLK